MARQYAGVSGMIDNCQVGVYASLVRKEDFCLINSRIYPPKAWIYDQKKYDKVKFPTELRIFKTKPQLALDMVRDTHRQGIELD